MNDIKFMCLGGCCASIYTLGEMRVPGPVDNLHSLNGLETIKVIFNKELENEFFSENSILERRKLDKRMIDNVGLDSESHWCEYETLFKHYRMNHNDPTKENVQEELKKRIHTLYDFIDNIKNEKNNYLIYALCQYDFKDGKFNMEQFSKGIKILKENGVLDKTFFLGTRSKENTWYHFYNNNFRNNKNYFEVELLSKGDKLKESREKAKEDFISFLNRRKILTKD